LTNIKEALAGELFATDGTKHLVRLSANLKQALCGERHPAILAQRFGGEGGLVLCGAQGALQLLP